MKTRPLIVALSAFAAALGLSTLLSLLVDDPTMPLARLIGIAAGAALLLAGAVALFQQRRAAVPLLAISALIYGVLTLLAPVVVAGWSGFGAANAFFYGSLLVRLALAVAAYFLVARSAPSPAGH